MTATPLREDNRDTYRFCPGTEIYTYSLRQGIDDGFLAPYRITPSYFGSRCGRLATKQRRCRPLWTRNPDGEYHTKDFERIIALKARTDALLSISLTL